MPSHYLKCDGCGAIIDRWPVDLSKGDGTFGRYQSAPLIEYAESIGWKHISRFPDIRGATWGSVTG